VIVMRAGVKAPGASGGKKGVDNGELKHYWTKDPEGLAKWANHEHPWTELYHHILKHVKGDQIKAKRIASAWYKDVFGHMPNQEKKGKRVAAVETERRATVSGKPWSGFTAAAYSPEQWRAACLIDTGQGDPDNKGRYKLPVREPGGALNRNACHAAASVLGGGRGGVNASPEQKKSAASTLIRLYRSQLNEEPPESLSSLAGRGVSMNDSYWDMIERAGGPPAFIKDKMKKKGSDTDSDGDQSSDSDTDGDMSMEECKAAYKKAVSSGDMKTANAMKAKIMKMGA